MGFQSDVSRSYASFSGSDIRCMVGRKQFAELQAISYSITREKAPIYTMGSAEPRAYSRNKRGIAGSLIWINFDRHGLLQLINALGGTFVANIDDVRPQYNTGVLLSGSQLFASSLITEVGIPVPSSIDNQEVQTTSSTGFKSLATPWYSDQVLPFDVTLGGCNENGAATGMKLFGLEIVNEGSGVSIDDAVQEMQATFVAKSVEPWTAVDSGFNDVVIQQPY